MEEENEDDMSGKIRKAESDNEKASQNTRSRMVDPNERIQVLFKKQELKEQKLNEKKKINEENVILYFLWLIFFFFQKFKECTFVPKTNVYREEPIDEKQLVRDF